MRNAGTLHSCRLHQNPFAAISRSEISDGFHVYVTTLAEYGVKYHCLTRHFSPLHLNLQVDFEMFGASCEPLL